MQITTETPRTEVTIAGKTFTLPQPFAEGHTITAGEAAALNQVLAENVRNNMARAVKKASEEEKLDDEAIQVKVDEYVAGYEFGARRPGGPRTAGMTPVEKEALKIAKDAVRRALTANNLKVREVGDEKITELAKQLIEKKPEIMEEAQRRVDAAGGIALEELGLG